MLVLWTAIQKRAACLQLKILEKLHRCIRNHKKSLIDTVTDSKVTVTQ